MSNEAAPKQRRGFACLSPERKREIASMGGKAAHASGQAHHWNPETAAKAGRKGGLAKRKSQIETTA